MDDARFEDALRELVGVIREMQEKLDYLHEEVDQLKQAGICDRLDMVEKEFGGMVTGLNDVIDGRRKREYASGFREKHPEFGRFEPLGKRLGLDVYGMAADNTFGKDDESAQTVVAQMLSELNEKFGDMVEALERLEGHEAAEHGEETKESGPEGEKPKESAMEIELDFGKSSPSMVEEARRYRGTRAG